MSVETAECLYTGMVHDTGVFRYSCTHPSTMRAAAALMEKGIDFTKIITETFDEKRPMHRTRFWGVHCWKAFFYGRKMYCILRYKKEMDFYQVKSETSGWNRKAS